MENHNTNNNAADDFGPVIYTYTRAQAIADGFQVEVSKVHRKPELLTRFFSPAQSMTITSSFRFDARGQPLAGQDEAGRLWDIVWMTRLCNHPIASGRNGPTELRRLPVCALRAQ